MGTVLLLPPNHGSKGTVLPLSEIIIWRLKVVAKNKYAWYDIMDLKERRVS